MARKKSRSSGKSPRFALVSLLVTILSGGGVGAYFNPDWPVVGPLVQKLSQRQAEATSKSGRDTATPARTGNDYTSASAAGPATVETARREGGVPVAPASSRQPNDSILIATFNIQVFGKSKISKPRILDILAQTVRQFDVVAIQEVRAADDDILPKFVAAINADGSRYDYLIGPRLGRTVSTEQYAFVYNTETIACDPASAGTIPDPSDLLHREPFVAHFRARAPIPEQGFSFFLVDTHTDPDEVAAEVSALADDYQFMRTFDPREDDVILLGDLNASETQLGRLGQVPGITWVVRGVTTNTRRTKAYDNILFDRAATSEYTGAWGVVDIESVFGISRDEALQVSDHFPVWAEFRSSEDTNGRDIADRSSGVQR
jgi:deoxyribonuclease-1-like protein